MSDQFRLISKLARKGCEESLVTAVSSQVTMSARNESMDVPLWVELFSASFFRRML